LIRDPAQRSVCEQGFTASPLDSRFRRNDKETEFKAGMTKKRDR
jgi:hypothetical protein